jgi:hypothetical protein
MRNPFSKKSKQQDDSLTVPTETISYASDASSVEDIDASKSYSLLGSGDVRSFRVEYSAYFNAHTTIHVTDQQSGQEAYTVTTKYRKPQVRVTQGARELATANFHNFKNQIDITLADGQMLILEPSGLGRSFAYASQATGRERLTWKPRKKIDDLNMVLLNAQGVAIARYKPIYKSKKRGGMLEMTSSCFAGQAITEEVMVVFLCVSHRKEAMRIAAASASAGY